MSRETISHVCLVGGAVSADWRLIHRLCSRYVVTLAEQVESVADRGFLKEIRFLVLDCSPVKTAALAFLSSAAKQYPELCIVLVDGGLTQGDIAFAFQHGAKDYFATPYEVDLLVERLDALCTNRMPHVVQREPLAETLMSERAGESESGL